MSTGFMASVDRRTQLAGRNRMELLLFKLNGDQLFGINVFKVKEVIRTPPLTHIPHSNEAVVGITNIRGRTISVIDLNMATDKVPIKNMATSSVIITEYNRTVQGFMVSGVDRIVNMNWKDVVPPPNQAAEQSYLTAVTRVEGKLVQIIDVEKVLVDVTDVTMGTVAEADISEGELEDFASRCHILVIDDSVVARKQIVKTLEKVGVNVTVAKNGAEGLTILKNWLNDADSPLLDLCMVLSDIEMPKMDGYTLTTEIRSDERLKKLHVLLHTSLSGVFNQDMVKSVGADQFIAKFSAEDLSRAVRERLRQFKDERDGRVV